MFAFAALLFEKTAECMSFCLEILKGNKSFEIKMKDKKD